MTDQASVCRNGDSTDLAQHAGVVFEQLRAAMSGLVQAAPGNIRRAVDLQRSLEIPAPLAWRAFKIAAVADRFDVVNYIPGSGEVGTLIDAARKKKVPGEIITKIREAMAASNDLLHEHAGSVASLKTMVASLRPEKAAVLNETVRRKVFQGNALLWGQQLDVNILCSMVCPGDRPGLYKYAALVGQVGFHQIRSDISAEIVLGVKLGDKEASDSERTPKTEFLHEFCSPGLQIHIRDDADLYTRATFELNGLGRRAAVDCFHLFTSEVATDRLRCDSAKFICTPSAMAHVDIMMPSTAQPFTASAEVNGRLAQVAEAANPRPVDRMPVEIAPISLGTHVDIPPAPDIPRYTEMVQSVLKRQGWYGMSFDIYRCRLAYPILHSHVGLTVISDAPPLTT